MAYFKIFFTVRRFSTSAYFLFSIWFNASMQAVASYFKLFTLFRLMEITGNFPTLLSSLSGMKHTDRQQPYPL